MKSVIESFSGMKKERDSITDVRWSYNWLEFIECVVTWPYYTCSKLHLRSGMLCKICLFQLFTVNLICAPMNETLTCHISLYWSPPLLLWRLMSTWFLNSEVEIMKMIDKYIKSIEKSDRGSNWVGNNLLIWFYVYLISRPSSQKARKQLYIYLIFLAYFKLC